MPDKKISDNKTQKNVQKKFLWIWVSLDILKLKCVFKGTVKETWKGGFIRLKPENLRSLLRHIKVISDVPVSRNLYKNCVKIIPKRIYVRFCIKFVLLNRSYSTNTRNATNLKTTISHRSLRNSGLLLLLFEFNNFSFLINIIDNIIYTSGSCHQNPNQWQFSIIVICLCLYHVTSILHCYWREFWSRDTEVYLRYIRFDIILTQFMSISQNRNIRSYGSQSTPEILRFQPIHLFIFPLQSLKITYTNLFL